MTKPRMITLDEFLRMDIEPGGKFERIPHDEMARIRAHHEAQRHAYKLPPAAYTRILLAAKDGEIPPDEATRRIVKAGGKVKIRPIPRRNE